MSNNNDFLNKITALQNDYYSKNKKNSLFKTKQKEDCAIMVSNKLSLEELLNNTFFIIPNTNKIFINYLVFKTFVEPSIYNETINWILSLTNFCISNYSTYEVHINLDSFTISAAQRYKNIIQLYTEQCLQSNTQYSTILKNMYIYNTPNCIESIISMLTPIIDNEIKSKIFLHNKIESPDKLKELLKN
jgi:hypothetical protein